MIQLRPRVLLTRSWYKPEQVQDDTQARTAGLSGSKGSCGLEVVEGKWRKQRNVVLLQAQGQFS